ncbi:hypothetical protein [Halomarina oriensis]|uniref:Lipoprotein n=1 Tax=Halomarina oriensis TaxID=671145 RepID=A0A6B0GLX3_9EURY|nr:hypothetical protein [Halomarina oriensis]MWG33135.1 hypothetical protein [Halomarina oriensis]
MKRRALLGMLGAVGATALSGCVSRDDVDEALPWDAAGRALSEASDYTDSDGRTHFSVASGGYMAAEWRPNGRLAFEFIDDPPMMEWLLIDPNRDLRASGRPPEFGGWNSVEMRYPLMEGWWELSGRTIAKSESSVLGAEEKRTGGCGIPVDPRVQVDAVDVEDGTGKAQLELSNPGRAPLHVRGVRFSGDVAMRSTMKHWAFAEGEHLLMPGTTVNLTSVSMPFVDGMPESFGISLWAGNQAWNVAVENDALGATAKNATAEKE